MRKISWLLVFFYSGGAWSQGEVKNELCDSVFLEFTDSTELIYSTKVSIDSTTIYPFVDEPVEFPGGLTAMRKFIKDSLQYPVAALELKIEGKCFLMFVVERDGTITNIEVRRGVPDCPECDREAIRVIRLMPKMKPGKLEGIIVRSRFNLPVSFRVD